MKRGGRGKGEIEGEKEWGGGEREEGRVSER